MRKNCHELNPMKAHFVSDEAGTISTLGAVETGRNRLINVQNVLPQSPHSPRPRKLALGGGELADGVLWMARSFPCGLPGGWPWNRRGANIEWRALDARNVKSQDLAPHTG